MVLALALVGCTAPADSGGGVPRPRQPQLAPTAELRDRLLAEGYALAGSAYATDGWAVEDGVRAGEDLYAEFRRAVAEPRRVYVWGESMGGLVTALLAERHPDWISGAVPTCAAVAGTTANFGSGRRPAPAEVQAALSGGPGLRGDYEPGPWPRRLPETCC